MTPTTLPRTTLPIDAIKENILDAFNGPEKISNIILKATPGSGKTTRVPLYLLEHTQKKIYILEPRRLAAKLAATQVAKELGEAVGLTVGYIFRYEKMISSQTRILFLTEGTFLKILSQNKNLDDVELVILDEFHERHLSTDAALSFVTKLQSQTRPDLKIMVMSATIETEKLETFLGNSGKTKTLELSASRFPLTINYLPNVTSIIQAPMPKKIRSIIEDIFASDLEGDLLVFLPGMREIRESSEALKSLCDHYETLCLTLHGDLDSAEQELVLKASPQRKIILSTNIAESSVTIPGIRIVIDSGLQRESSYNFFSGLPELKITKISKASATQRSGRANRLGEGHCFRLYAELDFDQRPYLQKSEILRSDLSELYLSALDLFNEALTTLSWFEAPPASALNNSTNLLMAINAIAIEKEKTTLTTIGKKILKYPLHPRLGRILVEAESESSTMHQQTLSFISDFLGEKNKERFIKQLAITKNSEQSKKCLEEIILTGYPDRVARARGGKYFDVITQNGETLKIAKEISHDFDPAHELWIVMDLNNAGEALKCIPIDEAWLYDLEPFPILDDSEYSWDEKKNQVLKLEKTLLGKLVLSENKTTPQKMNDAIWTILAERSMSFIKSLESSQEYERLMTLKKIMNIKSDDFDFDSTQFLKNYFSDQFHFNDDDKEQLSRYYFNSLKDLIDPEGIYNLETDFPVTISLTDRRKIPIVYDRSHDPFIESLIQDFYGLSKTPILAKGKIPLTLKLLGPHKLAIQVTQDLASFWSKTYPQMVKELSRDYPRHHWPVDPQNAKPILLKRQLPV